MGRAWVPLQAFNRGVISSLGLARTDLGVRIAMGADTQTNWTPRALGAMMLRAGWGYLGTTYQNKLAKDIEFIFSLNDMARLELTAGFMRVWIDDVVLTRPTVATAIANPTFASALTSWTDADESGAVSDWRTGGYLGLVGSGRNSAIRYQAVTVVGGDLFKEHALAINIKQGEVTVKVGSAVGLDDYLTAITLTPGRYSLAFTPAADIYVQLSAVTAYSSLVDSCAIESGGVVLIPTIWTEADQDLMRYAPSGDVIYVAVKDKRLQKIARYATRSWAVIDDVSNDGPMRLINNTPIQIGASAINGDVTLTATKPVFLPGHVGALFSIVSGGQTVSTALNSANQFTNPIKVTGILGSRTFNITITGVWVGTITLQSSVAAPGSWIDVKTWTANTVETKLDGFDNQIIYYRIGFKTAAYTSGTATATLSFGAGSITGYTRITAVASNLSASAIVLQDLGGTTAVDTWSEGAWSDVRGYPGAVALHEGRKWLAGKDKGWSTVAGSFASFDDSVEGDSAPISKSIGTGPIDTINWLISVQALLMGAQMSEIVVQSSTLGDPLTPAASSFKRASTQGSYATAAVDIDGNALFIQRCGRRIYALQYNGAYAVNAYGSEDLTSLSTEIAGVDGFVSLHVQRQPDTRIHARRADGKVALCIFDKAENINCWVLLETDGFVDGIVITPGAKEDTVYYQVRRTINGAAVRYYEKWALEEDCQGGPINKQADSFLTFGPTSGVVTGFDHLEGQTVVAWVDGKDAGSYAVAGGQFTLSAPCVTGGMAGLSYTAQYKSTKLAYASQGGTALTMPKKINKIGVILKNTHVRGLKYGRDFDHLESLPRKVAGVDVGADAVLATYDEQPATFGGSWDTDARLCLQAQAPLPCTLLAAIIDIEEHDA